MTETPSLQTLMVSVPAGGAPRMIRETTKRVGVCKRGRARLWADGQYLVRAGFLPGMFLSLTIGQGQLTITPTDAVTRHRVSAKGHGARPVIDLTADEVQALFGPGADVVVRVEEGRILVRAATLAQRIAERPRDGTFGSVFTGGGLADVAAAQAGLTPVFGVEWNAEYADIAQVNHPHMRMYHMSVHEAVYADLPSVEHLFLGVPCEPFSSARRVERGTGGKGKRNMSVPQTAHPLGDMTLWAFALILKVNPRQVTVENAPRYGGSETAEALVRGLERLGYAVFRTVLDAHAHTGLTARKRSVIVAMTPEADGTVPAPFPLEAPNTIPVGAYLDADVPEEAWFDPTTKPWVFTHAAAQAAKGNGFGFQVVHPTDTVMPVIKKRYLAGQGDSPVAAHPTRPDTYRWFTLAEIARFAGVPTHYDLGAAKTRGGEVIGQGVDVRAFTRLLAQVSGRGDGRRILPTPVEGAMVTPPLLVDTKANTDVSAERPAAAEAVVLVGSSSSAVVTARGGQLGLVFE